MVFTQANWGNSTNVKSEAWIERIREKSMADVFLFKEAYACAFKSL